MSTGALVMMVVSLAIVWGGLVLAVINLIRRGRPPSPTPYRDL